MNRDRFEQLALEHLDAVYRLALQLAKNPNDAADLVQETYFRAIRAAGSFKEVGGGMRPWLFKILHNVFFTQFGKAKRAPTAIDHLDKAESNEAAPSDPPPAWNLSEFPWDHVDERLKAAIEQLRPEYRSVLLLWGVEGMKYREIAAIHDVPIGTVMSRLHRARSLLAEQLEEFAEEKRLDRG